MASSILIVVARHTDFYDYASSICPAKGMSLSVLSVVITISDEDRAAKQSEVNLLMDEVERAQTRLLIQPVFLKGFNLSLIPPTINLKSFFFYPLGPKNLLIYELIYLAACSSSITWFLVVFLSFSFFQFL